MAKTKYCLLPKGLDCTARTKEGECVSCSTKKCKYCSFIPLYTPPPSTPPSLRRRSDECEQCQHRKVCSLKERYARLKEEMYPIAVQCSEYHATSVFRSLDDLRG